MKTKIKKRKKAEERECRELMWLGLSSRHPQQSSVYFTINPLKDNYIRINLEVTQEVTIIALQLDLRLLYLHSKIIKCNESKIELYKDA